MRILSLIPPMTQLNTPYPSTAYLTGFLRSRGFSAHQDDLAIQLVLSFLSSAGLEDIRREALSLKKSDQSACVLYFLENFDQYKKQLIPQFVFYKVKIAP